MSVRSKVLNHFLSEDKEQNPDIFRTVVHNIVESDLQAKDCFQRSKIVGMYLSVSRSLLQVLQNYLFPNEEPVSFEEPEELQMQSSNVERLLVEHEVTRERLVDGFFVNNTERCASLVKLYCNDELVQERATGWKDLYPKVMDLGTKLGMWLGKVYFQKRNSRATYPKEEANVQDEKFIESGIQHASRKYIRNLIQTGKFVDPTLRSKMEKEVLTHVQLVYPRHLQEIVHTIYKLKKFPDWKNVTDIRDHIYNLKYQKRQLEHLFREKMDEFVDNLIENGLHSTTVPPLSDLLSEYESEEESEPVETTSS
jgi:hypothetical protein